MVYMFVRFAVEQSQCEMSRLIDADAINPMRCPRSIAEMREWIDELPTAFDTDKVIEQLEAGMQKMCETICVDDGYEQEIYDAYRQGIYDAFTEAIEIVKKGGVE